MTFEELLTFVEDWMPKRMRHIYLPLLIGELVGSDGSSPSLDNMPSALARD